MSKVIMMCGVCGSGKTTFAKKKEKEGFIRISIDEEMWKLYGARGIDYPNDNYEELSSIVESKLQNDIVNYIKEDKNLVINFSFWNKSTRKYYKNFLEELGADIQLIYLKIDKETLKKRIESRNKNHDANSQFIDEKTFEMYYNGFEEPKDEGEVVITFLISNKK